ncbi:hypothetical protein ABT272_41255 [Streptomyces sp900105245]|uniref:Helicase n=1 Tax=Streptomyces sp. 900105245 TaxID=3154379 RepID=A0ABV1ULJ5_9ACTN
MDAQTAATRAEQLTPIDPEWNCSWPLDRQRHHRVLTDLATDEPGVRLPGIAPGVLLDGEDLRRWIPRWGKPGTRKLLSPEQQERLTGMA